MIDIGYTSNPTTYRQNLIVLEPVGTLTNNIYEYEFTLSNADPYQSTTLY